MTAPVQAAAPWIGRQLHSLLGRHGHAWLLQGPSGLGQYELGLALVQAWLCERSTPQGACGLCEGCHLVGAHAHPDLAVLMPETDMLERGWPLSEKAQKEIDDKSRKPSKEIRVDAMREVVAFAQRTSARGRGLAVLVYPAERMNAVTANALLKTLEEPAGDTRFVLATEATHQLLPTLRSRCQGHVMAWPSEAESLPWLQSQAVAAGLAVPEPDRVRAWLQAAGGRPSDALAWGRTGLTLPSWAALPAALARGDWSAMADWPAAQQLDVLQKLCHDLMARASGAPARYFPGDSLPPPPPLRVLARWSRELAQSARSVEHPFSAGLLRDAWAVRAQQVLSPATVRG
ncbi:MAG: DNA polymerase III subunit delta' [Hydrogenophaga sp.]